MEGRLIIGLAPSSALKNRAEHFRFGPVLDQNKQPNRLFFFEFLNRTEPKTGSNRLILIRFGLVFFPSKPVQTKMQCQDAIL